MSIKKISLVIATMAFVVGATIVPAVVSAQQVPPVGFEKIPGPSFIPFYTNIIQFPNSIDLFGKRKPVSSTTGTTVTTVTSSSTTGTGLNTGDLGNLFILDKLFSTSNGNAFLNTGSSGLTGSGGNSLGNLVVLDSIFGSGSTGLSGIVGGTSNVTTNSNLGQLFILDRLFANNNSGLLGGNSNTSLGNLILLDKVFGK